MAEGAREGDGAAGERARAAMAERGTKKATEQPERAPEPPKSSKQRQEEDKTHVPPLIILPDGCTSWAAAVPTRAKNASFMI